MNFRFLSSSRLQLLCHRESDDRMVCDMSHTLDLLRVHLVILVALLRVHCEQSVLMRVCHEQLVLMRIQCELPVLMMTVR